MQRASSRAFINAVLSLAMVGILLFGSVGQASAATVIYVKANATGAKNGTSWLNAYTSLQVALTHAPAGSGIQIWVARGTYKPTTGTCTPINTETKRKTSFALRNSVALYGGFAGTEVSLAQRKPTVNVTILDGDICTLGTVTDNSYHVVVSLSTNNTAILDGFTVKNGNANGSFYSGQPRSGGGIYNINGSPTLRNLVIALNRAADIGGAGMFSNGGVPRLSNVTFNSNVANNLGGGMYNNASNPVLNGVKFVANKANSSGGGGIYNYNSSPTLANVTFSNNTAFVQGGGMYNAANSTPVLSSVTFSGNLAKSGGGMANDNSSPSLTNVTFSANRSTNTSDGGGGMYNNTGSRPVLVNATFNGNAAVNGGAIYNNNSSNAVLVNVTFRANAASGNGGAIANQASNPILRNVTINGNTAAVGGGIFNGNSRPAILNSILWGDSAPEIVDADLASVPTITDSILKGGCTASLHATCKHVLTGNPVLGALQANGGYTRTMSLGAGSAAIDVGGVNTACAAADQRGVLRPQGPRCDMGAYEVHVKTFTSAGIYDGQITESAPHSGAGGSVNSTGATIRIGDTGSKLQYRGFLSFDTSSLPDRITIIKAKINVKRQSAGGSAFSGHGTLQIDLAKPYFGTGPSLVASDFQAIATTAPAGKVGSALSGGWYNGTLNVAGRANVNRLGITQLRLFFTIPTDNDTVSDYISVYSGNVSTSANWPKLTIYYNP